MSNIYSEQRSSTARPHIRKYQLIGDAVSLAIWQADNADFPHVNDVCWTSCSHIRASTNDILKLLTRSTPKISPKVVLSIGYNDSWATKFNSTVFLRQTKNILNLLLENGCQELILTNLPPCSRFIEQHYLCDKKLIEYWTCLVNVNMDLELLARSYRNVYLCDIFSAFTRLQIRQKLTTYDANFVRNFQTDKRPYYSSNKVDLTHFSSRGKEKLMRTVRRAITNRTEMAYQQQELKEIKKKNNSLIKKFLDDSRISSAPLLDNNKEIEAITISSSDSEDETTLTTAKRTTPSSRQEEELPVRSDSDTLQEPVDVCENDRKAMKRSLLEYISEQSEIEESTKKRRISDIVAAESPTSSSSSNDLDNGTDIPSSQSDTTSNSHPESVDDVDISNGSIPIKRELENDVANRTFDDVLALMNELFGQNVVIPTNGDHSQLRPNVNGDYDGVTGHSNRECVVKNEFDSKMSSAKPSTASTTDNGDEFRGNPVSDTTLPENGTMIECKTPNVKVECTMNTEVEGGESAQQHEEMDDDDPWLKEEKLWDDEVR